MERRFQLRYVNKYGQVVRTILGHAAAVAEARFLAQTHGIPVIVTRDHGMGAAPAWIITPREHA